LETTGAVDDIRCRFSSGAIWDIQAKRACNWDRTFSGVVDQWVEAVREGSLSDEDRLLLVSGRISARLRHLRDGLARLRSDPNGVLLAAEMAAIEDFRNQASVGAWLDVYDKVTRHATIVELVAESTEDSGFREASATIDGAVVAEGSGVTAVNILSRFFHTQAARAGSSGVEEWLQVLDEAKLPPGTGSPRTAAGTARATSSYRGRLGARRDLLEVDHLAAGVPPMQVEDLLDTFRVQLPATAEAGETMRSCSLAALARRWRSFVIMGLPGSGKSTALEQLAAEWSNCLDAPLPVLVRLHQLVPLLRARQHIGLEDLCRLGDSTDHNIAMYLADRLRKGNAVLLLDGLDECRDQVGRAASTIRDLAGQLGSGSGVLVSTREVTAEVAARTGLPVVTLEAPQHLDYNISDLVEHVMTSVGLPKTEVNRRREWVEEAQKAHPDVWSIPLFAVLLGVHAAVNTSGKLPSTRAEALVTAVQDSVDRWERQKQRDPGAWDPELHPQMILDGFASIAHELILDRTDLAACTAAVSLRLANDWGLAPARSSAAADDVIRWWTERVGVFISDADTLRPRLRLLSEVGDAMWCLRQTSESRSSWIQRIVEDPSRYREPALLACALDSDLTKRLIDAAVGHMALLLAADAVLDGALPAEDALKVLLDRLIRWSKEPPSLDGRQDSDQGKAFDKFVAEINERQESHDGPGWPFIYRLARLPLPVSLRGARDSALEIIEEPERRTVARSLSIATDCSYDVRQPSDGERLDLKAVLLLPVQDHKSITRHRSRRHISIETGDPVLSGRAEAALGALRFLGLDDRTAPLAARLGSQVGFSEGVRLFTAVEAAGFGDEVRKESHFGELARTMQSLVGADSDRETGFILEEAAKLGDPNRRLREGWEGWRLDAAATLFELLDPGSHAIGAGPAAVKRTPGLVRRLVGLAVGATGFSPDVVAEECGRALGLFQKDPLETALLFYVRPDPLRSSEPGAPSIRPVDIDDLRACLTSSNPWLFSTAARWIAADAGSQIPDLFWDALPDMSAEHRDLVGRWLLEVSERDDLTDAWLHGDDYVLRAVAAWMIGKTGTAQDTVEALARHSDLEVRLSVIRGLAKSSNPQLLGVACLYAGADQPTYWTCGWCGSLESMANWDCLRCPKGARSDLKEEIDRISKRSHAGSVPLPNT
jgi:hypothetical protein